MVAQAHTHTCMHAHTHAHTCQVPGKLVKLFLDGRFILESLDIRNFTTDAKFQMKTI